MAPGVDYSAMSLLAARAVAATAAGWISSGARVIAAVVIVGHGLFLSILGGDLGVSLTLRFGASEMRFLFLGMDSL